VDVVSECSKGCGRKATRRSMCNSCYQTYRNKQVAYGRWQTVTVDAGPVRAHVLALKAAGVGDRRIGELSGVSRSALQKISSNRPGTDEPLRFNVWRSTANRILAIPLEVDNRGYGVRIDSTGSLRRLRALQAIGWTQTEIAHRIGWTLQNLNRYFISDPARINRGTAVTIAKVFNELQLIPGPSERSRRHARKNGWAPPLAWDEDTIDDPAATPDMGQREVVTFEDRYTELRELGYHDLQIVSKLGIKPESLLRQLDRYGITPSPDLVTVVSSYKHRKRVAS
jgi:transcriptional regulator with XRE-family HTH domain